MITLPLHIRYHPHGTHEAVAWLLAGGDPAAWLTELVQCGFVLETLRLYPLPASTSDSQLAGVLVVPPITTTPAGGRQHADNVAAAPDFPNRLRNKPTTIAYQVVADRLFLPIDAVLHPPIDERELTRLLSPEVVAYVFHPTIGLIAVDEESVLRIRDLLSPPKLVNSDWDAARPGLKINERLISIELADSPSATSILEQAQEDIGSQSSLLSQLPPSPSEPRNDPLSKLGRSAKSRAAQAALWLTSMAPQTASKPTWIDSLQSWASSQLAGVGQAIDSIRNKELRRLLDLLDNNPDEGLRYAIPLDGPAHRGTSPPTNYLAQRGVDFSLSQLGGGGAGDLWQIDWQHYQRLRQSYHELAAREINLGRHRRAAYIYAELLHDLNAAASTLKDGGFYREAAVLYQERLNRPLEAARCFEDGGLLGEAISLYEELGEHERAGDLYRRIDQLDEAQAAYRLAADAHATAGDLLSAARILDEKMDLPDLAIEALNAGWPHSNQAAGCLQSLFGLFARLGRHDAARNYLLTLRDERYPANQTQIATATMASTAASYSSDEIRALAADSCRVVVGRSLPDAEPAHRRLLLHSVEQLASEDRLLRRDCSRFLGRTVAEAPARPVAGRSKRHPEPELIREFTLPIGVQWQSVIADNALFYAAGYQDNTVALLRGNWNGHIQEPMGGRWPVQPIAATTRSQILLAPPVSDVDGLWVHARFTEAVRPRMFSPTDQFPKSGVAMAQPSLPDRVLAIARGPGGVGWVVSLGREGAPCLVAYRPDGPVLRTLPLSFMEHEGSELRRIMMHARHETVYVAEGTELLCIGKHGEQSTDSFNAPIMSLSGTMPHTRTRLAIAFESGGYVLWPDAGSGKDAQSFGQDLSDFEICFTRGGALVAISASGGEVYSTQNGRVELIATLKGSGDVPLSVMPVSHVKQFAVWMQSGTIRVYRLP